MADPDPMTCDPGSRVYDPDPGTVIPDPIYLVTTLLRASLFGLTTKTQLKTLMSNAPLPRVLKALQEQARSQGGKIKRQTRVKCF